MAKLDVVVCDCEVFKHYFCMVAYECLSNTYQICESVLDLRRFYYAHRNAIWVFYNANYDRYIVKAALLGASNFELRELSDFIIVGKHNGFEHPRWGKFNTRYPFNVYDAKTSINGLKVLEAYMGSDIQETSVPFDLDRPLTPTERAEVLHYCKHDVSETVKVLKIERDKFKAQWDLVTKFNLPVSYMSKSMGRLASVILGTAKRREWSGGEWDCRVPFETFATRVPDNVLTWFSQQIEAGKNGFEVEKSLTTNVFGLDVVLAWGGAHGAVPNFKSTKKIAAWDVTSLYPSIMIKFGIISRNIPHPESFAEIYHDRIKYKAEGNPLNVPYKLAINSLYGLHGDKFSNVYDPSMGKSICVVGQLLVLDLACRLGKHGVTLVQVNTDAVYVEYDNEAELESLQDEANAWMRDYDMVLEREEYIGIVQRDVNNYVMIDANGKIKAKGLDVKHTSPLDNNIPIVRKALREYFAKGTPIADTIYSSDNLIDFQIVYKRQGKYDTVQHNGKDYNETVFRVFASSNTNDGKLYKVSTTDNRHDAFASCPDHCYINNSDINGVKIDARLDLTWYIAEAERRARLFLGD